MAIGQTLARIAKYVRYAVDLVIIRVCPECWLRKAGVAFGRDCRFYAIKPGTFGSEPFLVTLGDRVTVTDGVRFITHDGGIWVVRHRVPRAELFGKVTVGSRVFIGVNAILLPGTTIGDDSIVAAGSVVRGTFAPGSVIGGVPARVLGTVDSYFERNRPRITFEFYGLSGAARRAAIEAAFKARP